MGGPGGGLIGPGVGAFSWGSLYLGGGGGVEGSASYTYPANMRLGTHELVANELKVSRMELEYQMLYDETDCI